MSAITPVLDRLAAHIAELSAQLGCRVDIAALKATDRRRCLTLSPPGDISPNGACRILRAADGFMALNLARWEDLELVPAWLRRDVDGDIWTSIAEQVRAHACGDLVGDGVRLGLPVARVGEIPCDGIAPSLVTYGRAKTRTRGALRVVDLSALWAGPLCGAVFAKMGASVVRVESLRRPDPVRQTMPDFFEALNGCKATLRLDLGCCEDKKRLRAAVASADVLITSARQRVFANIGLLPEAVFAQQEGLVWIAITGYGWASNRVAFGDDAAAAGGLVRWSRNGMPTFVGDALADPLTGLAAAEGGLRALLAGGGVLVDAAMARCAAGAAASCGLAVAA